MTWTRLRQVALVTDDLEKVVDELREVFGLRVAYRDPSVAAFGLVNAVMPLGAHFIEVVCPTRADTAAGRQLQRMGGDGGYMVICHTDDHARRRRRVEQLGVRIAFEAREGDYRIMQLHPADTGGSFLEIDYQPGGEDPWGGWSPAGPDWQEASTGTGAITAVRVQSVDPGATARRWADILETDAERDLVHIGEVTVEFVAGPVDCLVGVEVAGTALDAPVTVCGVVFTPSGPNRRRTPLLPNDPAALRDPGPGSSSVR